MANLNIRMDLRVTPAMFKCSLAGFLLFVMAPELATESVTLSTYYPAPSGVYTQMITTQNTYLARDGGGVSIGSQNAAAGALDVENPAGTPPRNVILNAGLNVGINTTNPRMTLDVNGNILARQSSCNEVSYTYPDCYGGIHQMCSPGQYVTLIDGVMAKHMILQPPFEALGLICPGITVFALCCNCPAGGCPSL